MVLTMTYYENNAKGATEIGIFYKLIMICFFLFVIIVIPIERRLDSFFRYITSLYKFRLCRNNTEYLHEKKMWRKKRKKKIMKALRANTPANGHN